ncbi:MAG: hypothetical protein WAO83_18735 [Fuerstiella sp.]
MRLLTDLFRATLMVAVFGLMVQSVVNAQTTRKRGEEVPTEKALAVRLEKAELQLVEEYKQVAEEFYKQGNKEKAMEMLGRLKQLNPKMDGLSDHITSINEELMQENQNEFELDTRKTWEPIGNVMEGRPFRIAAAGDYKLTFSATVGVTGLAPDEESKDYIPGAPLGCLLATVVVDGKPGKPFPINAGLEHTPKKSGQVFLKVNVPEGARCVGKLKIQVSGYIDTGSR